MRDTPLPRDVAIDRAPVSNRLVAALPGRDRVRLLAACTRVELTLGDVLYEPGERILHAYFPVEGFISLLLPVEGHADLEEGLVGNEGMFGIPIVLGIDVSPLRALVQGSGSALRISVASLRRELRHSAALTRTLSGYACVLIAQLAQAVACNSFHALDTRLVCWLLMTHDRAHSDEFHLTHQFLSQMLGVRRVGITNAAGLLQKRKLLSYSRGDIKVLDRAGLEAASCSCYQAAKDTYERVFG